jgi:hypothetical protein
MFREEAAELREFLEIILSEKFIPSVTIMELRMFRAEQKQQYCSNFVKPDILPLDVLADLVVVTNKNRWWQQ